MLSGAHEENYRWALGVMQVDSNNASLMLYCMNCVVIMLVSPLCLVSDDPPLNQQ